MRSALRDKVVCITGAAGGIGRAIAKAFAWEGADLALLDRDKTGVEELAVALRPMGVTVQTTVVDLRTAHGVREGMQAALAPYGGVLDILVWCPT
jgi:NADP-dependent 3-hydroxy acid dehydrogenase YdfG